MLRKTLGEKAVYTDPNDDYKKQTCYNSHFVPDSKYIYVPKVKQTNLVQYDKASIGQTAYLPEMGKSLETIYKDEFLET